MVKKDIDSDEWVEKLDFAVKCCIDPTYQWKKIHKMLVDRDIPSKLILKIERNFVAKFNKRNLDFPISAISRSIPGDIKTILLNVASSAIFQAAISI